MQIRDKMIPITHIFIYFRMLSLTFSRYLLTGTSPPNLPPGIKVKGFFLDEGGRNKDESLYVYPFLATYFNLLYPTLPTQVKVKR